MNDRKNRIRPASLNHTYRLVWSEKSQSFVAVAEITPGRGKAGRTVTGAVAGLMLLASSAAWAVDPGALPDGESLTHGDATFTRDGDELIIEQGSERIITEWERFNIGEDAGVRFDQPGSDSAALNRILDENPSQILGRLEANGQIFLTNPAGITFGEGAQVNVGSLVASTLEISDEDFLDGRLNFENRGSSDGRIKNRGEIEAAGGVVALIANEVSNQGEIRNDGGDVALAAGDEVTLDFDGDGLTTVTVERGVLDALVENGELIRADGGQVVMTTQAKNAIYRNLVNNEGTVRARTLEEGEDGRIMLSGGMEEGEVRAGGTLDASAPDGGDGGRIETSAAQVDIDPDIEVTTHAEQGQTGEWVIDPTDVYIVEGDEDGDQLDDDELAEGVTTVHNNTLESALETTSVTIETPEEGGEGAGDIFVNADVAWSENTLTLSAYRDIEINRHLDASAGGHLTLEYAQGDAEGDYRVNMAGGYVDTTDEGRDYAGRISLDGASTFRTRYADDAEIEHNVITDASELDAVRDELDADHVLGGDVDLDGFSENAGWEPVGDDDSPFTGGFDGLGNSIGNLTIDRPDEDEVGLFGHAENASFRHVNLEGVDLTGADYVGALVGLWRNTGDVDLEGIRVTGNITSSDQGSYVGAVFGSARIEDATLTIDRVRIVDTAVENAQEEDNFRAGSYTGGMGGKLEADGSEARLLMSNVLVSGDVTGANGDAGGVTGRLNINGGAEAEFEDLNTSVTLESRTLAGGLFGWYAARSGSQLAISGVHASGDITVEDDQGGGLVGTLQLPDDGEFTLEQAYFSGSVSGGDDLGGLVGVWHEGESPDHVMRDVYVIGDISGDERVGGLIGATSPYSAIPYRLDVQNAYATGTVKGSSHVGGLVGQLTDRDTASIQLTNAFAANTVTGDSYAGGLVGKVEEGVEFHTTHAFYDYETNTDDAMLDADVYGASRVDIRDALAGVDGWSAEDVENGAAIAGYGLGRLPHLTGVTSAEHYGELPMATLFGGGYGGTQYGDQSAYEIASPAHLRNIHQVAGAGYHFELVDDLDLGTEGNWNPVGDDDTGFIGQLDGQGHAIRNLFIERPEEDHVGLFGVVESGTVRDLALEDVSILGGADTGGLAGRLRDNTTVSGVSVSGEVGGGARVGGLVGALKDSNIHHAYATGSVTGGESVYAGGLAGFVGSSQITGVYASGNVETGDDAIAGGLVGAMEGASIEQAYATGSVKTGNGEQAHAGGFVGRLTGDNNVSEAYSIGSVQGGENARVGGFAGDQEGGDNNVENSYWDVDTSGVEDNGSGLATGRTTEQLQDRDTFAGWSLSTEAGDDTVWRLYEGAAHPLLRAFFKDEAVITFTLDESESRVYDGSVVVNLSDDTPWSVAEEVDQGLISVEGLALILAGADAGEQDVQRIHGIASTQQGYDLDIQGPGQYQIDRRQLTLGGQFSVEDKVYDGTTEAAVDETGGLNLENLVAGEDLALTELAAAFADANAGEAITVNLTEAELADGDEGRASNYTLLSTDWPTTTATIDPRAVTLDGEFSAEDKVYDGSAEATLADTGGLSLENLVAEEDLALTELAAAFADANAGEAITVNLTKVELANGDEGLASNYTLSLDGAPTTTATIDPRELTLGGEFSAEDKVYDGTDVATIDTTALSLNNLVEGEALNLESLAAAFADANAGDNITVNLTEAELADGDEGLASNYTLSLAGAPTTTATIDPRVVNLTGRREYDGTTTIETGVLELDNLVGDETLALTGDGSSVESADVSDAAQTLKSLDEVALNDGDNGGKASNYTLDGGTHQATIDPRELTLDGEFSAEDKVYDGSAEATLADTGGLSLENLVAGEDLGLAELAAAFADANAGEAITVNLTEAELADGDEGRASNYTLLSTDWPTTTATIDPRELTLDGEFSAEDKVYDGSAEATLADTGGLSLENLVAEEDLALTELAAVFADANAGEDITVNLTEAELADGDEGLASNYTLSLAGAPTTTATIDPRELTLGGEFSVEDREYDGTTEAVLDETEGLSLENLVAGEDLALTELAAAFADANAGEAITVNLTEAELADGDEGRASNYTLLSTDWPTTTATIDPRAVTLDGEFSAEDKVYDGSAEATLADTGGLSLNNLVEGEALNLESLAAAFEQSDVGENLAVSLTGEGLADGEGGSADNYTLSLDGAPATTASIDPRELTLGGEFSVEDREYDGTTEAAFDDTEGLILENLVNGEDLALTDLAAAFADANAGEAITVNLTEAGIADGVKGAADNYTLSLDGAPTTTATIDPRTVTLGGEFTARNKVYDGTTEAIFDETDGLSLENLVDGEDLELTDLAAAFAEAGPGEDIEVSLTNAELEDGQNGEASNYALSPDGWPVTHASIEPEPEPEPEPEQEGVSAGDTGDVLRRADDSADGDTALENERRTDPVAPDMAVGPISGSATLTALMQSEILVDERDLSGPVELVDDDDSEEGQ